MKTLQLICFLTLFFVGHLCAQKQTDYTEKNITKKILGKWSFQSPKTGWTFGYNFKKDGTLHAFPSKQDTLVGTWAYNPNTKEISIKSQNETTVYSLVELSNNKLVLRAKEETEDMVYKRGR